MDIQFYKPKAMKTIKEKIIERLDKSFNNHWHSTSDLTKESVADDIVELFKDLEHYKDTTTGLRATDRPDLIHDPKGILFRI